MMCHPVVGTKVGTFNHLKNDFRCLSAPGCIWCKKKGSDTDRLALGCVKRDQCPVDDIEEARPKIDEESSNPLRMVRWNPV